MGPNVFSPLELTRGPAWKNRLALAPLTNSQSAADGVLSDDEYTWLVKRAEGGFGLTMTCACHVQRIGNAFPGQLGCWDDRHLPGLERLAEGIRKAGSVSSVQLHHGGIRCPKDLIGESPVGPSADEETGARALSFGEVEQLVEDFVVAALRCEKAGFDGVEIHGAHGYLICAFLSPATNRREDAYGERSKFLLDILEGIRSRCRPDFQVGVRLSPERYGLVTSEMVELAGKLLLDSRLDYLDMSLWDVFKEPEDPTLSGQSLLSLFTSLPRKDVRLGAAGKLYSGNAITSALAQGLDYVLLGRAAILRHNWPQLLEQEINNELPTLPVTREHLANEWLSQSFIEYMSKWNGFVQEPAIKS